MHLDEVASYYSNKLGVHGASASGVDWKNSESQILRFQQLCKIILNTDETFSITDLGCGYGALLDFCHDNKYALSSYQGIDICPEMITVAKSRRCADAKSHFFVDSRPLQVADYGIASGIFNVRLGQTDTEWYEHIVTTLDSLSTMSKRGFSFNCLTSYSDEDKKMDYLYYADPSQIFDLCKRRYSKNIALLHDYGLYEFTILVRHL